MNSPKVRAEKRRAPERRYKNELRGAWNMMTCSPEDPTGYLIAGHCYKDHGKQKKAIKVFNMGLNQVSIKHKEYDALRQGKQEAESRKNKRMDILGLLPLEIIHSIFDNYFDRNSITPYSRVCSTWRNIILNYSKFWEQLSFGSVDPSSTPVPPHHMLLPSISQHVQEVEISYGRQIELLFRILRTANFSKMWSLKIIQYKTKRFEYPIPYTGLSSALNAFSKTLTLLDLELKTESTHLPTLSDVINICNNLTKLRYVVNSDYQVLIPMTITAHHETLLKELVFSSGCDEDKMNCTELQKLLKHSPHLSNLVMYYCDDNIYTVIQKHGQSIQELYVHHSQTRHYVRSLEAELTDGEPIVLSNNNSLGLKRIEVSGITSPCSLLQLIKSHHLTLSYLSITLVDGTNSNDTDWKKCANGFQSFPLINLLGLNLCTYDMDHDDSRICKYILPAIIAPLNNDTRVSNQQTPNLQCLKIDSQGMISNTVLDAITEMPTFTALILDRCQFNPHKMYDVLKVFQRRSSNNTILTATTPLSPPPSSSSSLLTTLHVEGVSGLNDAIVLTASNIKSLTRLTIDYCLHQDPTVYKRLAQNISKLPLLKWLRLCNVDIKKDDLKILATSNCLCLIDLYSIFIDFGHYELGYIAKTSSNDLIIRYMFY